MIKAYLVERRSWIACFVCIQAFIILLGYLDLTIPIMSILYIVFLSTIMFIVFVSIRYFKETKYYKSLHDWENSLDLSMIAPPNSPFENIIDYSVTKQTEELKQMVSQKQIALEQEQDELLSWIHEVKTPLTAMRLIMDRLDNEMIKTQLTYEWLRIHLLLDQQLHQKRISFIENDLYMETIELKPLITKEIIELQSWCIQKGIGFELQLEEKEVISDAKWLAFIIRQLLTNAVKYSEHADIVLSSVKNENDQVVLQIQDFGRGIEARDMPRIFDKGFTSTAKHQDNSATGMGLYLTKKAAASLLITIDVQSKPNEGSTFSLVFPTKNSYHHISSM